MTEWTCQQCAGSFVRDKSGARPIRFCSQDCYQAWRRDAGVTAGQFVKGLASWNKGVKGLRLNPRTEWKKGQRPHNWLPVGSETIRTDKKGTRRAYVKLAEPNVWRERSIVVWEKDNGPLPAEYIVHHKDRDTLNDAPNNLQALTLSAHILEHRSELERARESIKARLKGKPEDHGPLFEGAAA